MEVFGEQVWFYMKDHEQQGPVGTFELEKLLEQGVLTGNSMVWTKDMDSWQMARLVKPFEGLKFSGITDGQDLQKSLKAELNGRPFVRFLARLFDLSVFSLIFIALTAIISPKLIFESSHLFMIMAILILYIIAEAFILSIFGNTLGKTLLHTKVKTVDGRPINFFTALKRSLYVNTAGLGLGVPILNVICSLFSYFDLKKHGASQWDKQFGTVVLYGHVNFSRILLVSLLPVALLIVGFVI
ncbi:RDD family protein [Neobacillus dielmonensis]|uniref:RDD family protein n=1 Tax=Neobacillus dielmonensis TaxID=1347369 RepID=UPI0005A826F8|nr:RDD family protein [Neobacillus dielmonensis]